MKQEAVWLAISIVVLGMAAALWAKKKLKMRRARNWPAATGSVTSTDLRLESRGGNQSIWVATMNHAYEAEGRPCSGQVRKVFMLHGSASKYIQHFRKGSATLIRYNPERAEDSVFLERDQKWATSK